MKKKAIRALVLTVAAITLLATMGIADTDTSDPLYSDSYALSTPIIEESEAPVEDEVIAEEAPAEGEAPVEDEVIAEEAPAEGEAPVEGEAIAEEAPAEGEAPVEDEVIAEEAPAEGEAPVEDEVIAEEAPAEEASAEGEAPVEEELAEGEAALEGDEIGECEALALTEPLAISRFSIKVIGETAPGEMLVLEYDIKTDNTNGIEVEPFIIEAQTELELTVSDTNARGKAAELSVSGAKVQDGRLYIGEERLKVRLCVLLPEEPGEYAIAFRLCSADGAKLTDKEADHSLSFMIEATETEATETEATETEATEEEVTEEEATEEEATEAEATEEEATEEEATEAEVTEAEAAEAEAAEAEATEEEAAAEEATEEEATEEEAAAEEATEEEATEEEATEEEAAAAEIPQAQLAILVDGDLNNVKDGDVITFRAVVEGLPENVAYSIGWEIKRPDGDWQVIEGETGADLSVTAGEDTRGCAWRFYIEFA